MKIIKHIFFWLRGLQNVRSYYNTLTLPQHCRIYFINNMRLLSSILCCVGIFFCGTYYSPPKTSFNKLQNPYQVTIHNRFPASVCTISAVHWAPTLTAASSIATNCQLPTAEPVSTKSYDIKEHFSQMETQHEPTNLKIRLKTPLHQIALCPTE